MTKQIDIIKYLTDNSVRFWTSGKNVKKGEINSSCFRCGDRSNHLRINQMGWIRCWKCNNPRPFTDLIQYVNKCNYYKAKNIQKEYETDEDIVFTEREDYIPKDITSFKMPYGIDNYLHNLHKNYLIDRGLDPDELTLKYNLMSCLDGNQKYKYRIVIPIIMDGNIVNFTARDVTDSQDPKYRDLELDISVIPKERCIYNYDTLEDGGVGIGVEGPTDTWNIGDGTIATLTTNFTLHQVNLIRKKNLKRFFLFYDNKLWDENAQKKAEELEKCLWFIPEILYIDLPDDIEDPGKLPKDDVRHLRSMIF